MNVEYSFRNGYYYYTIGKHNNSNFYIKLIKLKYSNEIIVFNFYNEEEIYDFYYFIRFI